LQKTFTGKQTLDAHFCTVGTLFENFHCLQTNYFFIGEMLLQKHHFWIGGLSLFTLLSVPCDDSISENEAGKKERNFAHLLPPIFAGCLEHVHIRGALGWKEAKRPLISNIYIATLLVSSSKIDVNMQL